MAYHMSCDAKNTDGALAKNQFKFPQQYSKINKQIEKNQYKMKIIFCSFVASVVGFNTCAISTSILIIAVLKFQ